MIVRGLIDRCFEARSRGRQALGFFLDRPYCLTYIDVVDYGMLRGGEDFIFFRYDLVLRTRSRGAVFRLN